MNGTKKTVIAAAVCAVVLGLAVGAAGFMGMGFDFKALDTAKYAEKTYPVEDAVTGVYIDGTVSDVRLIPSDDGTSRVECLERKSLKHTVDVENGVLTVRETNARKWYEGIGFNVSGSPRILVYLPAGEYKTLTAACDTGDVEIPKEFKFASADVSSNTGDAAVYASVKGTLAVETDTGGVTVGGASAGALSVKTDTGDINVFSASVSGALTVVSDTGEIDLTGVKCSDLSVKSNTGDLELKGVAASGGMELETNTGDIDLEACDGGSISIVSDTGDVEGTLLSPKLFEASSDTGRVKIPSPLPGGPCVIRTDTGDIKIEVLE